jgi:hypothetical protein
MLETYGVPFPVDNSSLNTEDIEDTEESDWWKRGPGGTAIVARPPRPRPPEFGPRRHQTQLV